jgi:hypothetical protein
MEQALRGQMHRRHSDFLEMPFTCNRLLPEGSVHHLLRSKSARVRHAAFTLRERSNPSRQGHTRCHAQAGSDHSSLIVMTKRCPFSTDAIFLTQLTLLAVPTLEFFSDVLHWRAHGHGWVTE